ncbi:helix-turn-helix domain-containing protein [Bacillus pseudomycoides]|uniref:Helix-turn-helix transcriptional regulator n=1 Tax=Bacillus pseudomycoides TaxID=64104 RepID=A0AAJ1ZAX1_9BACI|nr:helix-turn-helix transcriptional regulator [Bacillus pseudomycoides]MDR4329661.1 helix-turn-helix transcriptional regulator [Bacillus pseudomycoides]PDZ73668.1 XRE family transcriptional regulator [Bacillus pseudomycoides]PEJ18395.1 XRE family transcriptional regulator [Bacillus pseudomycoides]PEP86902.1 XRE family transcriptional regulator [Bacillus pseudomycoides]PFZ88592.1 XRE family transcriptional regulator [Bacillus pseudomycoides]
MNLGSQLKKFRESKNFSQEDVARKVGVTRQAVYKWESNKSYPDIDNLILLSELYEVTIDELIKGSEDVRGELDKKDKDECEDDDDENDFGFFIGIALIFIGIFIGIEGISLFITILGMLIMVFYSDVKKAIINEFKIKRRPN